MTTKTLKRRANKTNTQIKTREIDFTEFDVYNITQKKVCYSETNANPKKNFIGDYKEEQLEESDFEMDEYKCNFGREMTELLGTLGGDIDKVIKSKGKQLQDYTSDAVQICEKKLEKLKQHQARERHCLVKGAQNKATLLLNQWITELSSLKEQNNKTIKIIQQQIAANKETQSLLNTRLSALRAQLSTFSTEMKEQEQTHSEQNKAMQSTVKKKLNKLHKKIMLRCQKEEMENMQNKIKRLLFNDI